MITVRNAVALATGVATIGLLAAGCGDQQPPPADASCAKVLGETTRTTPTVAVLAQLGSAGGSIATGRREALGLVVEASEQLGAHVMLNGVGAGIDAPNLVVNTKLTGEGANDLLRDSDLDCKRDAIEARYAGLGRTGTGAKLDVFAALRTLQRDLEGVPHGVVHVVMLTSLLNTEVVDLTGSGALDDPARAINKLAAKGQNFSCEGWRVYAVGGSSSGAGGVDAAKDGALKRFWMAYFKHCNGTLVAYNTELAKFPIDGAGVQGADYRKAATTIVRRPDTIVATLSSQVLFDVGRSTLMPAASRELGKLVALIGRASGRVEVAGYTDDTGGDAINKPLSEDRARSVAHWLAKHAGVSSRRFAIDGYGSSAPVADNGTEGGRARNRRVVVTINRR